MANRTPETSRGGGEEVVNQLGGPALLFVAGSFVAFTLVALLIGVGLDGAVKLGTYAAIGAFLIVVLLILGAPGGKAE